MHALGGAIMFRSIQSIVNAVFTTDGVGMGREDLMVPSFMEVQSRWRERTNERVDLLLLPTTPMKAQPLPSADAPAGVQIGAAWMNLGNTSPFDVSHHPAMSVPCGRIDGLPVGMMLVGRQWEETTIYRAAHALEQSGDWREW